MIRPHHILETFKHRLSTVSKSNGRPSLHLSPLWHQLPVWILESDTLSISKISLKTVFLDKAQGTLNHSLQTLCCYRLHII